MWTDHQGTLESTKQGTEGINCENCPRKFQGCEKIKLVLGKVKGISKLHKYVNDGSKKD